MDTVRETYKYKRKPTPPQVAALEMDLWRYAVGSPRLCRGRRHHGASRMA